MFNTVLHINIFDSARQLETRYQRQLTLEIKQESNDLGLKRILDNIWHGYEHVYV